MAIFVFLGIPMLVFLLLMVWSLRQGEHRQEGTPEPTSPAGMGPPGDLPHFTLDYTGRLWVDKKHKGFFRPLRRPKRHSEERNE